MSDTGPTEQLPDTAGGVNLTDQEQEEIRARIDQVSQESRIDVAEETFSLGDARRGLALPLGVLGGVVVVVVVGLLVLLTSFRRGEVTSRASAGQYVSVEGRLIRALREESQAELGAKNQEIESIRSRLRELEEQQAGLEEDIEARIARREEEIRQQLQADIDRERARLIAAGTANEELAGLMATFEAERRAFYERRLEEFKQELEAERADLQANIDQLRNQYQTRLDELNRDREQIVAEYRTREAELRAQLTRRTQVAAAEQTSEQQLEDAGSELYELGQQLEQAQAVDTQVVGQIDRIRAALIAEDPESALAQVRSLRSYLTEEAPLISGSRAARRDADLFFVGQLEAMLESRIQSAEGGPDDAPSLIDELAILRQLRQISSSVDPVATPQAREEAATQLLAALSQLNLPLDTLDSIIFGATREAYESRLTELEATRQRELETAQEELDSAQAALETERAVLQGELREVANRSESERRDLERRIVSLEGQINDLEREREELRRDATRAELEDALREAQLELEESEAARALLTNETGNAQAILQRRVDDLSRYEEQVTLANERYQGYLAAEAEARRTNPGAPDTAARQELDEFLSSGEIRSLFGELANRVDVLFSATQDAGSSAALADAALIISDIAAQPSAQARLAMLQFEKDQIADDPELLRILNAMETMLTAGQ